MHHPEFDPFLCFPASSDLPLMTQIPCQPIFIVGAPRSGTTLLRTILNRHPNIGLCDETYYFYYVYSRQRAFGDLRYLKNRERLIDAYLDTTRIRGLALNPLRLRETLLREGDDYPALFLSLMRFYANAYGKARYGEKTPQHAFEADTLCRIYKDCRLIHLVRDPRDVTASLLRMPWGSSSVAANARLWRHCVEAAEICRSRDSFLRVKFEALVENTETELRRICSFIGEPYDDRMISCDSCTTADRWWFQRAQGPIDKTRREKWREELRRDQIAVVQWIAGSTMARLGYELEGELPAAAVRAKAVAHEGVDAITTRLKQIPRLWFYWIQPTQLASEEFWIDNTTR